MTEIHISEAQYVDPRSGNDKFYRTFVIGSQWVTQYGRNQTAGTFTKLVNATSEQAAVAAAAAKLGTKVKKGYVPSRAGSLSITGVITNSNLCVLDELVGKLPLSSLTPAADTGSERAPVIDLDLDARRPDCSSALESLLGTLAQPTDGHEPSMHASLPLRPMLAAVLPADALTETMASDEWVTQFKYDGDRVLVEVLDGQIRVLNRQGEAKTRNVSHSQLAPFTALHRGRWVFDGEIVGRTLVIFDLVAAASADLSWITDSDMFDTRYRTLLTIAEVMDIPAAEVDPTAPVVLAPTASDPKTKARMLSDAVLQQREGLIVRRRTGPYEQGRRSTGLLKHKLIKDVDAVITELHPGKQSASLAVFDDLGNPVRIGSVSTLGKGPVSVGEVWVVTFLYVTDPDHPRLFQPRLIRQRLDKSAGECLLTQLVHAGTNRIV